MIILCADDYGLTDGVSRGILELAAGDRLSATSAMVTFDRWASDATRLSATRETTALGLHLNFTLGSPLIASSARHLLDEGNRFASLRHLTYRALTGRLNQDALRRECEAQIKRFQDHIGALPDFLDGHQHVHGLPCIRDALLKAIQGFTWAQSPLIRTPSNLAPGSRTSNWTGSKQAAVATLTRGLRPRLKRANLPTNETFAGFSNFELGSDYRSELGKALKAPSHKCHLVMCHPGYVDEELRGIGDPLVERRLEELEAMARFEGLPDQIWHPNREPDGSIDWVKAMTE